jgi:hypothetical protein
MTEETAKLVISARRHWWRACWCRTRPPAARLPGNEPLSRGHQGWQGYRPGDHRAAAGRRGIVAAVDRDDTTLGWTAGRRVIALAGDASHEAATGQAAGLAQRKARWPGG